MLHIMDFSLDAPDHTTLSRRSKKLKVNLMSVNSKRGLHLIINSTGLSMVGEGEWAAAKHGKRSWRKLHLGVDRKGQMHAQMLTDSSGDDAKTGLAIIKKTKSKLSSVIGDAAYDRVAIYRQAGLRGAKVVVPPTRSASVSPRGPRSAERGRTIQRVNKMGRRRWRKESGYHRQGTVENAFSRYKAMLGERLHARGLDAQKTEVAMGCTILNRLLDLGRPRLVALAR